MLKEESLQKLIDEVGEKYGEEGYYVEATPDTLQLRYSPKDGSVHEREVVEDLTALTRLEEARIAVDQEVVDHRAILAKEAQEAATGPPPITPPAPRTMDAVPPIDQPPATQGIPEGQLQTGDYAELERRVAGLSPGLALIWHYEDGVGHGKLYRKDAGAAPSHVLAEVPTDQSLEDAWAAIQKAFGKHNGAEESQRKQGVTDENRRNAGEHNDKAVFLLKQVEQHLLASVHNVPEGRSKKALLFVKDALAILGRK